MKPMQIKQARTLMLRSLDRVYPSGMNAKHLEQVLCTVDEAYGFDLLRKDVAYLRDKGYVSLVTFGGAATLADLQPGSVTTIVKLTPDGLDIAQNLKSDPALEI